MTAQHGGDDALTQPSAIPDEENEPQIKTLDLACAPVTALLFLEPWNILLAAQGPNLKLFDVSQDNGPDDPSSLKYVLKLFSFQRIHGIVRCAPDQQDESPEKLLVFGGKEIAIVECDRDKCSWTARCAWKTNDWILAGSWLSTSSIILITSHNTLLRYEFSSDLASVPILSEELHCEERPLLWSACFSQAYYEAKEDVHVAVGTIMNEILVWRPFLDEGTIERQFIGHHGSVFFVTFAPGSPGDAEYCLASGSDDRDVRLWRWQRGSEQYDSRILRGHTHRPWRAAFSDMQDTLVTVGEDLRCLVWDTSSTYTTDPASPVAQYRGHEGKNIWSVAISSLSNIIATGGSDGAIRLFPLESETQVRPLFTTQKKDTIVAFDVSADNVVLVTRSGKIWHAKGEDGHATATLLYSLPAQIGAIQAEVIIHLNTVWIWFRHGLVLRMNLTDLMDTQQQEIDALLIVVASHQGTSICAAFDRRTNSVQLYDHCKPALLRTIAQSSHLETDKLPKFLIWINITTILLADSGSSYWIYRYDSYQSSLEMVHSGRLPVRGSFAMQADELSANSFWVANKDACRRYRLSIEADCGVRIEPVSLDCMDYGIVREIGCSAATKRKLFLACDNNGGRLLDEAGNILKYIACTSTSAQTLRMVEKDGFYHFYSNTGSQLCHQKQSNRFSPILQEGLQGREIWSVDFHCFRRSKQVLCATSAEDNTIKLSRWRRDSIGSQPKRGDLETLFRCSDTDGTLQNVRWSESSYSTSEESDSALLFVTAAKERLYALRVTPNQQDGINVLKIGEVERSSKKKRAEIEDSRILTLSVCKLDNGMHAVLSGSSDGYLKLWNFDESRGEFSPRWQSNWHDRCLLAAKLLQDGEALWAVSAATDGHIAVWDLSRNPDIPAQVTGSAHQSGVNCLDVQLHDGKLAVISGGDDCSVAYTVFSLHTSLVPIITRKLDSHSSSVKGISFFKSNSFISTSTDQRLTSWELLEQGDQSARLERTSSVVTSVADVADMAVLSKEGNTPDETLVAISGIGLELLAVSA